MEKKAVRNELNLGASIYESKKIYKLRSMYDDATDSTIVLVEFDRATVYEANEFYDYINNLIENNRRNIILDMESVYFIDSVFFGTLIKLLKQIDKGEGFLKIIVDYKSKPELLSISNFDGIFELYPNLFEALNQSKAS